MTDLIEKKGRLSYVDLIETIAIFMVIIYHSGMNYTDILSGGINGYIGLFFSSLLSLCVPIFFFVNGYLLLSKPLNLKKHIKKTICIILLTIIWGVIKLIVLMPIKNYYFSPKEFLSALYNLKYGWIHTHWYLCALVCIYLLFPIIKSAFDNNPKAFIAVFIVCFILSIGNNFANELITVCSFALHKNIVFEDYNFFKEFNVLRGIYGYTFVYFCGGGLFKKYETKIRSFSKKKRITVSALGIFIFTAMLWLVAIIYTKQNGNTWDVTFNGYGTLFTFLNTICLFSLILDFNKRIGIIELISLNTLGIYLTHDIIISIINRFAEAFIPGKGIIIAIVYATLVLFSSLLFVVIISKIPVLNKLVKT